MTVRCNLDDSDYRAFRRHVLFRYRKRHYERYRRESQVAGKSVERNRRPAPPLDATRHFGRAVHAQACVSGGGR